MKRIIHTIITLAVSLASANAQISGEIKPNVSDVSVSKNAGYDLIKLSGANHVTNQVGMPELPVISKTFVIPTDAQITNIEIKENRKTELQGTFRPYPVQPPVTTGGEQTRISLNHLTLSTTAQAPILQNGQKLLPTISTWDITWLQSGHTQ